MCTRTKSLHVLSAGDLVRYANSDEWRIAVTPASKDGHVVLTHDLVRHQLQAEFDELNPGCGEPVRDQPYRVRRTNLTIEEGWLFIGYSGTTLGFMKRDGLVKEVPLHEIQPIGVSSGPTEIERFLHVHRDSTAIEATGCGRPCNRPCGGHGRCHRQ